MKVEFRLATTADLPQLKAVYREIAAHMRSNGIDIWDDVYPCEFFGEDIERQCLYVLTDGQAIVAAFGLCGECSGESSVEWADQQAKALYLERFGVHSGHLKKGIGSIMLQKAIALAGDKGAAYLRLFVVDSNEPAINLYRKNGFMRREGVYDEVVDDSLVLREYGFEIKTTG